MSVAALSVASLLTKRQHGEVEVRGGLRLVFVRVDVLDRLDRDGDALCDLAMTAPSEERCESAVKQE